MHNPDNEWTARQDSGVLDTGKLIRIEKPMGIGLNRAGDVVLRALCIGSQTLQSILCDRARTVFHTFVVELPLPGIIKIGGFDISSQWICRFQPFLRGGIIAITECCCPEICLLRRKQMGGSGLEPLTFWV